MIRSLYTSAHSMLADNKKLDSISNNISNADTIAYKRDIPVYRSFSELLTSRINDTEVPINPIKGVGNMSLGNDIGEIYTDYTQGELTYTEKNLNAAITNSNNSFFSVGTFDEQGNINSIYYTRNGSFAINESGQLITTDGLNVLGQNGPITILGEDIVIDEKGYIWENNELIDQLAISTFRDTANLIKLGNNLIKTDGQIEEVEFNGQISQGYLEESNVNVINEMVNMITVMRSYEANQKMIQNEDTILQKAVSEIGSLR